MRKLWLALLALNAGLGLFVASPRTLQAEDGSYYNCCKTDTHGNKHCCVNCCSSLTTPDLCRSNADCGAIGE
jgi:hypothetical protein